MAEKTAKITDMEEALLRLTVEQRAHLKLVIGYILECYLDEETHGLLLTNNAKNPFLRIIAINSTDMDAAEMLESADHFLNFRLLDDAPPKEMMN